MNNMQIQDVAWVAGILEGEGTFIVTKKRLVSGNKSLGTRIAVTMADEDVIRSLQSKTGLGTVYGPYDKGKHNLGSKLLCTWVVGKRQDVEDLLLVVLPFLHERRSIAALKQLDIITGLKIKAQYRKDFYRCGHVRAIENSYGPHCKTCADLYQVNKSKVSR